MSFEEFWWGYPRRTSKFQARTAYDKALKVRDPRRDHAGSATLHQRAAGRAAKIHQNPARWLNQGCWLDYETAVGPPPLLRRNLKSSSVRSVYKSPSELNVPIAGEMHVVEQARPTLYGDPPKDDREWRARDHLHLDRFSGGNRETRQALWAVRSGSDSNL